jgi:hypothetical protein
MIRLAVITALLLSASIVGAQDEDGLFEARLRGPDPSVAPAANPILRPQLRPNHDRAWKVAGAVTLGAGALAIASSWVLYVARQNYRLTPRMDVTRANLDEWEGLGAWSLWLGVGGATAVVAGEYLVLPEANGVPTLAWIAGAAGLGVAAIGAGFWGGGTHCAPSPVRPGVIFQQACTAGTSDLIFGPLLMLTSAGLLNIPVTYLVRDAFYTPEPLSLQVGPGSLTVGGRF